MQINSLKLHQFRAHADTEIAFSPKINLVTGLNGAGKTNLIEALHYICIGKSFLSNTDRYVVQRGGKFFEVIGKFSGETRSELKIRLAYQTGEGKKYFVNGAPRTKLSELIGMVPVVVFSPADHAITAGAPEERRAFMNKILSQTYSVYLKDMIKYRRALKQRNTLLLHIKLGNSVSDYEKQAWDEELIITGQKIIRRRITFVNQFKGYIDRAWDELGSVGQKPSLTYKGIGVFKKEASDADIHAVFSEKLAEVRRREEEQGRTLAGPHKDELIFKLDDFLVRRYASQGQHRTFGMALKLATFHYLADKKEETPILLLDDVFGDLDTERSKIFLDFLRSDSAGQTIITSARKTIFGDIDLFSNSEVNQHIQIADGAVVQT